MEVHLLKLRLLNGRGNLRALADATVTFTGGEAVTLRGCRVIQQPGQCAYVALPQIESADGRFFAAVSGPTELREAVEAAVLAEWKKQEKPE